jgi:integrase/recombinase XerD
MLSNTDKKNNSLRNPDAKLSGNLKEYLQERYTESTAQAYEREIEIYIENFSKAETEDSRTLLKNKQHGAQKALHKDIVEYLGALRKRYPNGKTVRRILGSIKAYYDFLSYTGKRKDNPAKSIRLRDKENRDIQLQDLFTPEELESLMHREERFNALEYRNKVLMSLLIYQALQVRELEAITLNDINLEQATIYIKATGKTGSRTLQLKPNQILLFHQYITESRNKLMKRNPAAHLILLAGQRGEPMSGEDITKHIKRNYGKRFTGRKVNAKTIRQSVITNLLKQGNDLRIVQVFVGHKYPSTTERYKQTNVEALKSAINQYHPIK